ncbi:hypothetical protein [Cytobacillus horneckiae]|uniref:Uncharacterized protein n=1 Tax=Cytobacillus horneckiae TaxID=549687 RepID=A0A2N0ZMW6_9BACI|nr:hypothetical protein [Cytobacillus horneckiae]PKG30845.1 hypothetical protein CWS20_01110 [Cytobacillus horneckiae]
MWFKNKESRQDELKEFVSKLLYLERKYNMKMIGNGEDAVVQDLYNGEIYNYEQKNKIKDAHNHLKWLSKLKTGQKENVPKDIIKDRKMY